MAAQIIAFPQNRVVRDRCEQLANSLVEMAKAENRVVDRLVEILEKELAAGRLKLPARFQAPEPLSPFEKQKHVVAGLLKDRMRKPKNTAA